MTNKRSLKAWVAFDGTGRVKPGSLTLRDKKPKNGYWKEITAYECCNQAQGAVVVNVAGAGSYPLSSIGINVFPQNGNNFIPMSGYSNGSAADINELAAVLNSNFKVFGDFSVKGSDLIFIPNTTLASLYAKNNTTALSATIFQD